MLWNYLLWGIPTIHHSFSFSVELSVELLSYLRSRSISSAVEVIHVEDTMIKFGIKLCKTFPSSNARIILFCTLIISVLVCLEGFYMES